MFTYSASKSKLARLPRDDQPSCKNWHSEAVNKGLQNSDKIFSEVVFFNVLLVYVPRLPRSSHVLLSIWIQRLISSNSAFTADKACEGRTSYLWQ